MEPIGDPSEDGGDFAEEHQDTTVDPDISSDSEDDETESPEGWSGLDRDGPP